MTELRLALSLEAIRAMGEGAELVFDIDDDGELMRVMLRCDDAALETIRDRVEKAMLHFLPPDPNVH